MSTNEPRGDGESPAEKTYLTRPARPPGSVDQFAATVSPEGPDPFAPTVAQDESSLPATDGNQTCTLSSSGEPKLAEPPPPPPDIPGYVLLDELGRGGMGVVYKALQARLNRMVALKMILAGEFAGVDARARFMGEAEVVARLQHPNIVQLYEFNVHNGVPYFSLEYVDGGTLNAKLARVPLPAGEAAALVETLARAVHYAHLQGVVHRDLKPGNILLQTRPVDPSDPPHSGGSHSQRRSLHGDGSFGTLSCVIRDTPFVPKITDFGLAKTTSGPGDLTRSGAVMGTPSYMAPEQAGGHSRTVGAAADTYALGAILYECLTGRPPFHAASPIDTIMQVVHEDPVPPKRLQSNVPRDLETICLKCLHKDQARRYGTTLELADDLARYLNGDPIRARPVGTVERCYRWARRHKAAAALIVVTTFFLVAAAALGWAVSARLGVALREAEEQRELAESNATEANRQREAVAAALRTRVDSVEAMMMNIDARLEQEGGLDSIRREFLDDARRMSDQLLTESPDDPGVLRQAGRVYHSLGNITRAGRDYRASDRAYQTALQLETKLTERFPDNQDYLIALSRTLADRAYMLWAWKKYKEADAAYAEAIALYDRRAARGDRGGVSGAALYRYYRANILEEQERTSEAIDLYRDVMARLEKLAAERADEADAHAELGDAATSLALAVEPRDPDETLALLRRALAAHQKAQSLGPQTRRYRTAARDALHDLYEFCLRRHRDADLAALAGEHARNSEDRPGGVYNSACYLALAAKVAAGHPTLPAAEKAARVEKYATQAIARLHEAIDLGFTDRAHMLKDRDLDALRGRADYQAFVTDLEKRFPGRPITPADLLASLTEEYDGYRAKYDRLRRVSLTVADRARALRARPDFADFGDRVLRLAADHPATPAAVTALVWVVETAGQSIDPQAPALAARAIAQLGQCADRPEFKAACTPLSNNPTPAGDALLRSVSEKHPDREVRGLATYALGVSLSRQASGKTPGGAAHEKLLREAEDLFTRVEKEYDWVPHDYGPLGVLASRRVHALRSLSIGRPARDITGVGLDGQTLALSGSKGKVTLVFFWANWCGYCRQLFPTTREWVEAYRDRPFAVLGVNSDPDKDEAVRAVEIGKLTWPSIWDGGTSGGSVSRVWQIEAYPTLYLIDHTGVIRYTWQGKPGSDEIREAIEKLLAKVKPDKKG